MDASKFAERHWCVRGTTADVCTLIYILHTELPSWLIARIMDSKPLCQEIYKLWDFVSRFLRDSFIWLTRRCAHGWKKTLSVRPVGPDFDFWSNIAGIYAKFENECVQYAMHWSIVARSIHALIHIKHWIALFAPARLGVRVLYVRCGRCLDEVREGTDARRLHLHRAQPVKRNKRNS